MQKKKKSAKGNKGSSMEIGTDKGGRDFAKMQSSGKRAGSFK